MDETEKRHERKRVMNAVKLAVSEHEYETPGHMGYLIDAEEFKVRLDEIMEELDE